jgi:cytochrome b561
MNFKNTVDRFGVIAICLHWLMAVLLIGLVILGLYMKTLNASMFKLNLVYWHKEFGFLALLLVALRLLWRLTNIDPPLKFLSRFQQISAKSMHFILYILMFSIPISGWMITSTANLSFSFFGLFTVPVITPADPTLHKLAKVIHEWCAYGLIGAFSLHALAALQHHFIYKDPILRRIL